MAKATTSFVCRECGYNSPKYLGKCPNCGNWSTMEEFKETTSNAKRPSLVQHSEEVHKTKPMRLKLKCVLSVSGCKQTDFTFTLKQT